MEAEVCFRRQGGKVEARPRAAVAALPLQPAVPWGTFRWYSGQKHCSGTYWSATVRDHVIHESRLGPVRPLFADFDSSVRGIAATGCSVPNSSRGFAGPPALLPLTAIV
jgi:hypothetical protein